MQHNAYIELAERRMQLPFLALKIGHLKPAGCVGLLLCSSSAVVLVHSMKYCSYYIFVTKYSLFLAFSFLLIFLGY
jgi:hypothetical protein